MSRLASKATAGYFPTPNHLIPNIATLVSFPEGEGYPTFLDPCAGMGEAIFGLIEFLLPKEMIKKATLYTCEMEPSRQKVLSDRLKTMLGWASVKRTLLGDAFRITFEKRADEDGVGLLFLNPPYDTDPVYGRLEHKFLTRFAPTLMTGGVLLFVVPFHALKASATILSTEFSDVRCFRFPDADYAAYKQVVLVAKKVDPLQRPSRTTEKSILAWAEGAEVPVLPEMGEDFVPTKIASSSDSNDGLSDWVMRSVDVKDLLGKIVPWKQTVRGGALMNVPNVMPDVPVEEVLLRKYPVAMPPRPAHIASGIASGLFNGARITSDNPVLPPLLVKGVFDREYKTVEEKTNKDGDVTAVVQIQQPKLVTTVLDLHTRKYHTLGSGTTNLLEVSQMGVGDLLRHYGTSLMGVMEAQCPIAYDPRRPEDVYPLPESPRKPFTAQAHAVRALVKLLGGPDAPMRDRKGKASILLGEIGSGKTTVALMAAKTLGARRILALCPPHLLQSWTDEVASVRPDVEVRILQSVHDVDTLAKETSDRPLVAILSRETAKLSHGWEGVNGMCPACGEAIPRGVDHAKKRSLCEAQRVLPACPLARLALHIARKVMPYAPKSDRIYGLLRGRFEAAYLESIADKPKKFPGVEDAFLDPILDTMIDRRLELSLGEYERAILWLCAAAPTEKRLGRVLRRLAPEPNNGTLVRELILLAPLNGGAQSRLINEAKALDKSSYYSYNYNPWKSFDEQLARVVKADEKVVFSFAGKSFSYEDGGTILVDGKPITPLRALLQALGPISKVGRFVRTPECGGVLYQAIPQPRRYALAQYIASRHPRLFDFLVLDEGHEYATEGSAQELAAHRLTGLGVPTILMTGTIMNGYAESLFTNMWALSPAFRAEFTREERSKFVERYGYRKRIVSDRDRETKEPVTFGSVTDRVERTERVVGNAPGVLPLFLLRHLLPMAVTLHKTDLAIDLPKCEQERSGIKASGDLMRRYRTLQNALINRIRKDKFTEKAGMLWGALSELPSYLDRATADVGNVDHGRYAIYYPESGGGELVVEQEPFPSSTILPKEAWMLDYIESEIAAGRNVLVFAWHVNLLPRLARLISERIGESVPVLHADKVSPAKRQEWINKEVVRKKKHVLVTNPVAIQTGLNNLVHFATEIWMENPACNPTIFRQAVGRIDRIGQRRPTKILVPVYNDTLQVQLYDLLMNKVAVSVSTDGLDPESALRAAGVGEDEYITGLSIGKQLWAMIGEGHFSAAAA